MISRRATLAILAGGIAIAPLPVRAQIVTPPRGSALRKTLLDTLRPIVESQMRTPVEFVVHTMNVMDSHAFLTVDPQKPGGEPIDPKTTAFRDDIEFMDGLTVHALLSNMSGKWIVIDHVTGPTDAAFVVWPDVHGVPRELVGMR